LLRSRGSIATALNCPPEAGIFSRHIRFWMAALYRLRKTRPGVVIGENYFTVFPAWLGAKLVDARFVYDAYELIIPEPGKKLSLRDRIWYMLERWAISKADLVIAANAERAKLMAEHYKLNDMPEVMRNIPPEKKSDITQDQVLRKYPILIRRNENERFLIYQGDISLSRGIRRFVESLAYLPDNYRFIVAGGGPDFEKLCGLASRFAANGRFTVLGRVENHLLPAITALADVGIVTYPYEGLNNIYCAPNKIFEYAQAGLPVVATDQPPLKKLVQDYGIGELIGRDDLPVEVSCVIVRVMEHRGTYCQRLAGFMADHRWETEAERVRTAIIEVMAGETTP